MTIAPRLRRYLDRQGAIYELIEHPHSQSAIGSAAAAHVPPSCVAKAVLLDLPQEAHDHLLAILSADRRIDLDELRATIQSKPELADEREVAEIFEDCEQGAVPPFGYGVAAIVDDQLFGEPDIFFEAGDHRLLIHMEQAEFRRLASNARHGRFGTPWTPTARLYQ